MAATGIAIGSGMGASLAPVLGTFLTLGLVPAMLALAIAFDLTRRIIPNLVVVGLVLGFGLLAATGLAPDMTTRLLMGAATLAAGFVLFSHDLVGAGDAKLAAALALWLDPAQMPAFLLLTGLAGGLLVLVVTLVARSGSARRPSLPYGVALAGIGLVLLPHSQLMAHLA